MKTRSAIRSLFLPIAGDPLLLPSAVLAEVIGYRMPESLPHSPDWLLGLIEWRGVSVPIISFEEFCGRPPTEALIGVRIAILNGITGNPKVPFLGLRIRGIPRLTLAREESLILRDEDASAADVSMYTAVAISDQPALIPDLETLERLIASYLKDDTENTEPTEYPSPSGSGL